MRRILLAYTVNRLGTWLGFVALAVAVYDHTRSAAAVAALLLAGQVLPAFVVPAVVARVEASRRRGELSGLYFLEGAATAALAVLISNFWLPAILLLVAVDGTAALAANALLRSELARAAREDEQEAAGTGEVPATRLHEAERRANAALNVCFSATFLLGPALGGLLVAGAGAAWALVLDAASFMVCGALLLRLRPDVEEARGQSVRARLAAAWDHIREAPALRRVLMIEGVALIFFESAAPIEVAYAKSSLNAGSAGYGVLLTAWGVGVVLGSLMFARAIRRSLVAMLSLGTAAVGAAYIGLALAPSLLVACGAALVGGFGQGIQWASLISTVQRLTPPPLQGRLMGAVESLGAFSPAIGLTLGGALAALYSPRTALFVVGVGAVCTTGAFLTVSIPAAAAARDPSEPPSRPPEQDVELLPAGTATRASRAEGLAP
jgi:MFS family permease